MNDKEMSRYIEKWLTFDDKMECPFLEVGGRPMCPGCRSLFLNEKWFKGCPCYSFSLDHVIKVAEKFIAKHK